ncbi:MAG: polyprenyl synthetase family protein [Nitrososphaerales archaeon]
MSWVETADRYGKMIEEHLKKYFSTLSPEAERYHRFIHRVYDNLAEYILRRGKRLASTYTLITYSGYRGGVDEAILRVCSGIELYRHSILLHDDLVDGEELRRGGRVFQRLFEGYDERLGDGVAVFTGDIAYTLAVQRLFSSGFERGRLARVVMLLNEGFLRVNESQILDLLFEYKEPDVEEWYTMASKRAASLFKTTILIGAVLGDAPEDDVPILTEAAENIGYSFDIQDDIIDTFASKAQYGREPAGDIVQGKKPLHIVYALKMADDDTLNLLRRVRSNRRISGDELKAIRRGIRSCGALNAAKERSRFHAEKANELIAQVGITGEAKEFFNSLLTFVKDSLDWYK